VRIVKMILQVNLENVVGESNAYLLEDYRENFFSNNPSNNTKLYLHEMVRI